MNDQYQITADELRGFIERVEHLNAEKKDIAEQTKEVFSEAKGRGYSAPIIREIIKLRAKRPDERQEMEAVMDMYKAALGMN